MSKTVAVVVAACCSLAGTARATEWFVVVSTTGNSYSPAVVFIQPGDTVTWTYAGGAMPHNVQADDNSYSNPLSSSPWTFSHVFPTAMTSRYYCIAHGAPGGVGMSGVVVVGGRNAWAPSDIAYTLNAWEFTRTSGTEGVGGGPSFHRNGAGGFRAGAQLPSGAQITGIEISACHGGGAGPLTVQLHECTDPDGACTVTATVAAPATPPCGFTHATVSGVNADNLDKSYFVQVILGEALHSFRSVRVFYRKVVSPPPPTPTFSDVPASDPRFRFVEALAAAGITGGCGGGQYCPDAALTRGQMAVFLSVALGLYWPN